MGLLDYNDDFPNNSGIANINIGYGLRFIEAGVVFGQVRMFDCC
jgi:hypothetical protein